MKPTALVAFVLAFLLPGRAYAELRHAEIKTRGMD